MIQQQSYTLSNSFRRKKYLKYDEGGGIDQETVSALMGTIAAQANGALDAFDQGNEFGRQSTGITTAKGALSGASTGMMFGPIGAGVGAIVGGISSLIGGNKAKKAEERLKRDRDIRQKQTEANYMAAQLGANPELYQGRRDAQYFETGGQLTSKFLANQYAIGGTVAPKSSDGTIINGNSHNNGGVKLPQMGIEVEGDETTKGDYVFSDKLGFAAIHKPIMVAKGKIESKPYTQERANSIKLLNEREDRLKATQEYLKQQLGYN